MGKDCITNIKTIEYSELRVEAIFMITVKDFLISHRHASCMGDVNSSLVPAEPLW